MQCSEKLESIGWLLFKDPAEANLLGKAALHPPQGVRGIGRVTLAPQPPRGQLLSGGDHFFPLAGSELGAEPRTSSYLANVY